jgi:peptidoglycan/LPS O-acetylase OafA/YrhL
MNPLTPFVVATASIATGITWFVLSVATGLTFHLMPAAPMLVAIWARRAGGPDTPIPWRSLWGYLGGGLIVAVLVIPAISLAGGSLDEPWQIATVTGIGAGIAIWIGRRDR